MTKISNELALIQFLDRAKALSNVPEVFRCLQVTLLICETLAFGVRAEAEIIRGCLRRPGWAEILGHAPIGTNTGLHARIHTFGSCGRKAEQLEMAKIAIIRAFRDAAQAGECWFIGDTSPLLAVEDGQTNFEELAKIKVYPRAAVEWLLSKPKREHLVPMSLRGFCNPAGSPPMLSSDCATARHRENS